MRSCGMPCLSCALSLGHSVRREVRVVLHVNRMTNSLYHWKLLVFKIWFSKHKVLVLIFPLLKNLFFIQYKVFLSLKFLTLYLLNL